MEQNKFLLSREKLGSLILLTFLLFLFLGTYLVKPNDSNLQEPLKPSVSGLKKIPVPGKDYEANQLIVKLTKGIKAENLKGIKYSKAVALDNEGTTLLTLKPGITVSDTISKLQDNKQIAYAAPNYIRKAAYTPNDPMLSKQWAISKLQLPSVWNVVKGSPLIKVAVIDTGVDLDNAELKANLIPGYDFVSSDSLPNDEYGHGTMVAGIIGATMNNKLGIAGIASGVKIMPIRVLNNSGYGNDANIARGITWAADKGAKVINLSLGGSFDNPVIKDAVNYAHNKGAIIIAAVGNENTEVSFPAAYNNVIGVTALDYTNRKASYANFGPEVDIAAPGNGILSTSPNTKVNSAFAVNYHTDSGTSFAAPQVSGVVALLLSKFPTLTPIQIETRLKYTGLDLGTKGFDNLYGYGLVNPLRALTISPSLIPSDLYETNDTLASAKAINFDKAVFATLGKTKDQDWYKVQVPTKNLELTLTVPKTINGQIQLYNLKGQLLKTINTSGVGVTEKAVVNVSEPGTYYVKVSDVTGVLSPYEYSLYVSGVDIYEPNNKISEAKTIQDGAKIYGKINPIIDADYFKITLTQSSQLMIRLKSSPLMDGMIDLFDSNATLKGTVDNNDNGKVETLTRQLAPGDYYIRIQDSNLFLTKTGGNTDGYQLEVTINPPPVITSAEPANNGEFTVGKDLVVTYNEPITNGPTYNLINIKDIYGNLNPVTTSIQGNQLTIHPVNPLQDGMDYRLEIPGRAIMDLPGYVILDPVTINFKVPSQGTPPVVAKTYPGKDQKDIVVSENIEITFNKFIQAGTNLDSISLVDADGKSVAIDLTVSSNKLVINPKTDLVNNTLYSVTIPEGAVTDTTGQGLTPTANLSFTTIKSSSLYKLNYQPNDVIKDPNLPFLYLLNRNEKKITRLNYITGSQATLNFASFPQKLALGLGDYADELYVTLTPKADNSFYYSTDSQKSSIGVINLNDFTLKDEIPLEFAPNFIFPGHNGKIYLTNASSSLVNQLFSVDRLTKAVLDSKKLLDVGFGRIHPTMERLYIKSSNPNDGFKVIDLSGDTIGEPVSIKKGQPTSYNRFNFDPTGEYLLLESGEIFRTNADITQDLEPFSKLSYPIKSPSFTTGGKLYTISAGYFIYNFNSNDFSPIGTMPLQGSGNYLFADNDHLVTVVTPEKTTTDYQVGIQIIDPTKGPDEETTLDNVYITDSKITVTYNQPIFQGSKFNDITFKDSDGNPVNFTLSIKDKQLELIPESILTNGQYTLEIPGGAINDAKGEPLTTAYLKTFTLGVSMDNNILTLPFAASGVTDMVTDPDAPVVYLLNSAEKRLYTVNYQTGASTIREFSLKPERLELGLGEFNQKLFVSLLQREHNHYWFDFQRGNIAVIDRSSCLLEKTIPVGVDPYEIIASADGKLYITTGSGQHDNLDAYDLKSGQLVARGMISEASTAVLYEGLNRLYNINAWNLGYYSTANGSISNGKIYSLSSQYYLGNKFYLDPLGKSLISSTGKIFTVDALPEKDFQPVNRLDMAVNDLAYKEDASKIYTLPVNLPQLNIYDGTNYNLINTIPLEGKGKFLQRKGQNLVALVEPAGVEAASQSKLQILGTDQGIEDTAVKVFTTQLGQDGQITITFNKAIISGIDFNAISVSLKDNNGNQPIGIEKSIVDNQLIISPQEPYNNLGTYEVTIPSKAVTDQDGLELNSQYQLTFSPLLQPDGGIMKLPFTPADTVVSSDGTVYMLDKEQQRLYAANPTTGKLTFVTLTNWPGCLPQKIELGKGSYSDEIYVSLRYNQAFYSSYQDMGKIVILDKATLAVKAAINTTTDPFSLTSDGKGNIYTASRINYYNYLESFNRETLTRQDSSMILEASYQINYHPVIDRLYLLSADVNPNDFHAFNINNGMIADPRGGYDSIYHGDYALGTDFAIDPQGKYIFANSGNIFTTNMDKSLDLRFVKDLGMTRTYGVAFNGIAFADDMSKFYTLPITSLKTIQVYNGSTLTPVSTMPLLGKGKKVFTAGNKLTILIEPDILTSNYKSGIQVINN